MPSTLQLKCRQSNYSNETENIFLISTAFKPAVKCGYTGFYWSLRSSMPVTAHMGLKSFLHCHKVMKGQRVFDQSELWYEEFKGSFFRTDPARGANFQCLLGKYAKSRRSNKGFLPWPLAWLSKTRGIDYQTVLMLTHFILRTIWWIKYFWRKDLRNKMPDNIMLQFWWVEMGFFQKTDEIPLVIPMKLGLDFRGFFPSDCSQHY